MRILLLLLVTGAVALAPFIVMRRPWALRAWQRVKKLFLVYVIAITISALIWLALRWDDYYG